MERNSLLAHSARFGYPEQCYREHISEVIRRAVKYASGAAPYTSMGELLLSAVRIAGEYHDLGKLDEANQNVLRGKTKEHLPVDHADAGTAYLLGQNSFLPALFVFSHHGGLPSISEELSKVHKFRVRNPIDNGKKTVREITDENLARYLKDHVAEMGTTRERPSDKPRVPAFLRFALSCLVDADHADTARHYGRQSDLTEIPLFPAERLRYLDTYINSLPSEGITPERLAMRQDFYRICHKEPEARGLHACSMPVGTGKTTSVMAHLLKAAECFNLRRIFVVLPFINIIDQSVDTYRQSLILSGENPEAVVAAHHHRADYEDPALMAASFLWNAPITVTTAVQFFETLAANRPAALRKLHNLVGSAIFIDEAHAALPAKLWPQAWKWLQDLVQNWGCHIVLGSGSLAHFWKLREFSETDVLVQEIAGDDLYRKAADLEKNRIAYPPFMKDSMGIDDLCEWLESLPGPRIVVVNTVQSAASLAVNIAKRKGRNAVEHLSTSLAPIHRAVTLARVKSRLDKRSDENWTLVATTCAEAGLNFSFRSAAREISSLASLIQVGGRVNRQCEYGPECKVWCFRIKEDGFLKAHQEFKISAAILEQLFDEGKVSPYFCTQAMLREVRIKNRTLAKDDPIVQAEKSWNYPKVSELFTVIDEGQAYTVVVDPSLRERLEAGEKPLRKEMQELTVRMREKLIRTLGLSRIGHYDELFFCPTEFYDDFIGYMKGILQVISASPEGWIA